MVASISHNNANSQGALAHFYTIDKKYLASTLAPMKKPNKQIKTEIAKKQRLAIRAIMEKYDLKVSPWCQKAGLSEGTLRNFLNGDSDSISSNNLELLANATGLTAGQLLAEDQATPMVPVLGHVGAGEAVTPIDDLPLLNGFSEKDCASINCEFVDSPPGGVYRDMVALRVRGDSMEPYLFQGDIVYYNEIIKANFNEYVGKRVIVKLKDGRAFIKVLRKGTQYGRYRLESFNSKDIEDVELEWCAKVAFTKQG